MIREGSDESFLSLLKDDSVYEVFPPPPGKENEAGDRVQDADVPSPPSPPSRRRVGVEGRLFDEACMPVDWSFIQQPPATLVNNKRDGVKYPSGRARCVFHFLSGSHTDQVLVQITIIRD